jgi:Ran GTPase-activating protein (RanGAP) involved in mRNA processing and transport
LSRQRKSASAKVVERSIKICAELWSLRAKKNDEQQEKADEDNKKKVEAQVVSPQKAKQTGWTGSFFQDFLKQNLLPFLSKQGKLSARSCCKVWHRSIGLPMVRITPRRLQKSEKKSVAKALALTQRLIVGPLDKRAFEFLIQTIDSEALRLKALEIQTESINLDLMTQLCAALEDNTSIDSLVFNKCKIDAKAAEPLLAFLETTERIESIDLSSKRITGLGSRFAKILGSNESITSINLSDTGMTGDELAEIAGVLMVTDSTLRFLDISTNPLKGNSLEHIGSILEHGDSIVELKASKSLGSDDDDMEDVFSHLDENKSLTALDLSHNWIPKNLQIDLADALEFNTSLRSLNLLACRELTDEFLERLGTAMEENKSLTYLGVSSSFTDTAMKRFCASLQQNSTLLSLNLSCSSSVKTLGEILGDFLEENTTITSLNLSSSTIRNKAGCKLAEAMRTNTTLRELNLDSNYLDKEAAVAMGKMLHVNTTLRVLGLSFNQIDVSALKALSAGCKANSTLETLRM